VSKAMKKVWVLYFSGEDYVPLTSFYGIFDSLEAIGENLSRNISKFRGLDFIFMDKDSYKVTVQFNGGQCVYDALKSNVESAC
jgi:hypothetical protein